LSVIIIFYSQTESPRNVNVKRTTSHWRLSYIYTYIILIYDIIYTVFSRVNSFVSGVILCPYRCIYKRSGYQSYRVILIRLLFFANGNSGKGYYIDCIYESMYNFKQGVIIYMHTRHFNRLSLKRITQKRVIYSNVLKKHILFFCRS